MGGALLVNDVDPSTSSYTVGASSVGVYYTTTGMQSVVISGVAYNDYLNLVTPRALPSLNVLLDGLPVTGACEGIMLDMSTDGGSAEYDWAVVSNGNAVVPTGGTGDTASYHAFTDLGTYYVRLRVKDECCGWSIPVYQEITITPGPVVDLGVTDTTICQQNTLEFDAGPGYDSYLWSPTGDTTQVTTVDNMGIYSVVVTDANGCSGEGQVQVGVSPPIQLIVTPDGPTSFCVGNDVTLSSASGFAAYLWSDGTTTSESLTVSQSGDYFVSVVDNLGCTGLSQIVQVSVNALPNAAISADGPVSFCQGDSVALTAPAGYPTYNWSTSSTLESTTVSTTQEVTVTVTNSAGCSNTDSIDVLVFTVPNPVIDGDGPLSFCFGDHVVLSLGQGYSSYLWSSGSNTPIITVTETGEYGVSVLDFNGCLDSTLIANPVSVTVWDPEPLVVQTGDSLVVTNSGDFASIQWYLNGNQISGAFGAVHVITESGNYTAVGVDVNGCEGSSFIYEMTCCVGVDEVGVVSRMRVYPNPSDGIFTLEVNLNRAEKVEIIVSDLRGKQQYSLAKHTSVSSVLETLDLRHLASGVYSMQLVAGERSLFRKLIVN
jgi:hypothetical protein